ncbi:LruC domain-containing protein [Pedobacter sp. UYP24]
MSSVVLVSCKKNAIQPDPIKAVKATTDIKVPTGFTWENSRNINFTIGVKSINLLDAIHVVSIYNEATGKLLTKGSATLIAPFKAKVYLSNLITSIYIKAYNNYSAAEGGSTSAFEDQWPIMGDYDVNDLVITARYNAITNSKNIVVQVTGEFSLAAAGGSTSNGFGVEFPIPRAMVSKLKGAVLEAEQPKAVIILFTDTHKELSAWNTVLGAPTAQAKNYSVTFDLIDGPELDKFGTDYNGFIFNYVGASRREVHALGKAPTALADLKVFGTLDDASDLSIGKYYVTKTGLPFCINLPAGTFSYPVEYTDISKAYLHFKEWAESGGKSFPDWYSNLNSDYRNNELIYKK